MRYRLPPHRSLLALECVIRTGGVTAAAAELGVTYSAVSKQLAVFQDWLGQPVFADKRHGMVPTVPVAQFATAARQAFDQLQVSVDALKPERKSTPSLRVIAPASFAMRWLMPRLLDFQPSGRSIDVMVRPIHTREDVSDIPFDVAVGYASATPAGVQSVPFVTEQFGLFVAPDIAPSVGHDLDREYLRGTLLIEAATRPHDKAKWLERARIDPRTIPGGTIYPHLHIAIEAMLAGKGALIASSFILGDLLHKGEVIEPWPQLRVPGPNYVLAVAASPMTRDVANMFVGWLLAQRPQAIPSR